MNFRLATNGDLMVLKDMYKRIIENMYENDIKIWDDVYPCEFLQEDIENNRLYVLENEKEIVAACALCDSNEGEAHLKWKENTRNVWYIDRLGVNANYLRKGIGGILLKKITELAKEKEKNYVRLFVVDVNSPAINLYLKNGFRKVDGVYEEKIDENYSLREYGFELEV